jgi:O-antigen ligase
MRKVTYLSSLILVFLIPWEDSISTLSLGSLAKLMGVLVAGLWLGTILIEGRFRKPHLFHVLLFLFFVWNFVSAFWTLDIDGTLQRIKTYSQIFILILIYWEVFQKSEELMAALQAYVFGAYILVASTIYNFMMGNAAIAYETRFSATGVNAVDQALILMIGLPIAIRLFFAASNNRQGSFLKAINIFFIPLSIFTIILTGSRTSLIAIIPFGIFLVGTQQIKFDRKIIVFAAVLILLLILAPFIPHAVIARLGTIGDSIGEGDLGGRVELWREGIALLAKHPILGIGSGTMDLSIGSAVHNTFISIAAETGLIGFTIFLITLGLVVYQTTGLPKATSGLWLAIVMTWAIGVLSLSWEFRKLTWVILNFVIIESNLVQRLNPHRAGILISEERIRSSELKGPSTKLNVIS